MKTRSLYWSLLVASTVCARGVAEEWSRFRGPNGGGLAAAAVPIQWSEADYQWKVRLAGVGHSSPVVWQDRIFVHGGDETTGERRLECRDASTGQSLWERSFAAGTHKKHVKNSYATSTPAVDAQHVYLAWAMPERLVMVAIDHQGRMAWEAELGAFDNGHGFGASPIVHADLVVLANDQMGASSLIALDARTGQARWQTPRPKSGRTTYSTPCVFEPPGRPAEIIFTNWEHGITAVDPKTGGVNWELDVFGKPQEERAIASPVVAGNLVVATCGFVTRPKHLVVVRPDPASPSSAAVVWKTTAGTVPHIPTLLAWKDRLYLWSDKGIVTCLDLGNGQSVWQERVGGNFFGSPVLVDGRIYCISEEGEVVVLAAADTFQLLARNPLGERCQSTPAVAGGRMYVRTYSHLLAIGSLSASP